MTLLPSNLPALILAAGRGARMRPLTDHTPKPLLTVAGRPMIEWHLLALAAAGVRQVVINCAWLEQQIPAALGDGSRWGLAIRYTLEGRDHGGALETAGGIKNALPLLLDGASAAQDGCFWLVSGDIVAPGFRFTAGLAQQFAGSTDHAHLWLVPNPDFHQAGDFALQSGRVLRPATGQARPLTYANLALVRPSLVQAVSAGQHAALGPLLFASAAAGRLGGTLWAGDWHNVGTPAQLAALNAVPTTLENTA